MHEPTGVTKLAAFPRMRLIERELFAATASEVDLLGALGAPSGESQPALGQGPPLFFWDLSFSCGLLMGLQFDQIDQRLIGFLDEADVEHALRHLGVDLADLWLLEREAPDVFASVCDVPDRSFSVTWTGAGGAVVTAAELTERDARCRGAGAAADGATDVRVESDRTALPTRRATSDEAADEAGDTWRAEPSPLAEALVQRAAGAMGRPPATGPDAMPATFDPGVATSAPVTGLAGFDEDDFGEASLLDELADTGLPLESTAEGADDGA